MTWEDELRKLRRQLEADYGVRVTDKQWQRIVGYADPGADEADRLDDCRDTAEHYFDVLSKGEASPVPRRQRGPRRRRGGERGIYFKPLRTRRAIFYFVEALRASDKDRWTWKRLYDAYKLFDWDTPRPPTYADYVDYLLAFERAPSGVDPLSLVRPPRQRGNTASFRTHIAWFPRTSPDTLKWAYHRARKDVSASNEPLTWIEWLAKREGERLAWLAERLLASPAKPEPVSPVPAEEHWLAERLLPSPAKAGAQPPKKSRRAL